MTSHDKVKTQVRIFKNIACSLALVIASVTTVTANDQTEGGPPGLQKKGGVPPGLQKKGGVPPGQAKKQAAAEAANAATTTTVSSPPPPSPGTPPPPKAAESPKAVEYAKTPQTAPATTPATQKTAKDQAARLEDLVKAINTAAEKPQVLQQTLAFVSKQTGFTVKQLQDQHEKFPRMGASAFLLGNIIAIHSKHEFRDLAVQRLKGLTWAQIANSNGIAVSLLLQKSEALARAIGVAEHASR